MAVGTAVTPGNGIGVAVAIAGTAGTAGTNKVGVGVGAVGVGAEGVGSSALLQASNNSRAAPTIKRTSNCGIGFDIMTPPSLVGSNTSKSTHHRFKRGIPTTKLHPSEVPDF